MSFIEDARILFKKIWSQIETLATAVNTSIPETIRDAITRSINSRSKTYRYVLPTQLLAKVLNSALDCTSIQATSMLLGAFDARSLAQEVIVPFDRENHSVLGGAPEPYANNPLRIPAIIPSERAAQKYKEDFNDLILVLDYAQHHPREARQLLFLTLQAVRERLSTTRIVYPVPNRVSFDQVSELIPLFLEERTGGLWLQSVVSALFNTLGEQFGIFARTRSGSINAADASTGSAADVECVDAEGKVVIAVEVKDRQLTLRHMLDKLPIVREKGVAELLFLIKGGVASDDIDTIAQLQRKEFATGQNLYVAEFDPFFRTCLVLLGEAGRRILLQRIGYELDTVNADMIHRQKWRDLMAAI